jgi:hypothetical protein
MVFEAVECPTCGGLDIHRHGQSATEKKDTFVVLNVSI